MAKILVLDDDRSTRTVLGLTLSGAGHEVVLFESGKLAVASIDEGAIFDLVVTDILMPEMDGIEVIKRLRAHGSPPLILAVSGATVSAGVDVLKAALNLGAEGALRKPFSNEVFLATVAEILGRRG